MKGVIRVANLVMAFGASDVFGALIVLNLCLAAVLFTLLAVLVISQSTRKYYARIRLGSPRLDRAGRRGISDAMRILARAVVILLIIAAIVLILFYLARLGMGIISSIPADNNGNATNLSVASKPVAEALPAKTVENSGLGREPAALNSTNATSPKPISGGSIIEKLREFIFTYAGYVIAGFLILIILISVLGNRRQD